MNPNRLTATAPLTALSFPGSGHTYVSYPHPNQPYRRNTLLPRNGCPSIPASLDAGTAEISVSNSDLSNGPSKWILQSSGVLSRSDAHATAAHSVPRPRNRKIRISHEYLFRWILLSHRSTPDTDTSEPTQCDTDNAISNVITYGICSLHPPYMSMLRQQLDARIAVSGQFGHSHPGPA